MPDKPNEMDKLSAEIVGRWVDTLKKSLVSFYVLLGLSKKSMWSKQIYNWLIDNTGWSITERGFYRTLQRLERLGLIEFELQDSPAQGADRKVYSLTALGRRTAKDFAKAGFSQAVNSKIEQLVDRL